MNQYFSAELSQKVKRGMRETRLKGYYQGGGLPYGYRVEDRKIVVDEEQAKNVRYMFEQFAKGVRSFNIRGKRRKNEQYHSYKGEVGKIADNLLNRDFTASKPFEKLTTDVTQFKVCNDKVYLSPVMDLYNREIVSYSISLSPDLAQIREMLQGLTEKLPEGATPIFHSDQGWQYQHAEYQRYLKEHNIIQSMSRKGNRMDNGAMENFFGRLKVEMYYGEKFETVDEFVHRLKEYIDYWNNERISLKLKGMSPVQYRTHSHII